MPEKLTGPSYYLFLDDYRIPSDAYYYTGNYLYMDKPWIIAHKYDDFIEIITEKYLEDQLPVLISFDHDLAHEHYKNTETIDYSEFKEKTGYDCAKWLVDFCIDKNVSLPDYLVHSMNPVGKANIISLLKSFKCEYCGGEGYHKMSCVKSKNPTIY